MQKCSPKPAKILHHAALFILVEPYSLSNKKPALEPNISNLWLSSPEHFQPISCSPLPVFPCTGESLILFPHQKNGFLLQASCKVFWPDLSGLSMGVPGTRWYLPVLSWWCCWHLLNLNGSQFDVSAFTFLTWQLHCRSPMCHFLCASAKENGTSGKHLPWMFCLWKTLLIKDEHFVLLWLLQIF